MWGPNVSELVMGAAEEVTTSAGPLQVLDPAGYEETGVVIRATAAFAVVVALGGLVIVRDESYIRESVEALVSNPLSSIGYGIVAHLVVAFGVAYVGSQVPAVGVSGVDLTTLSFGVGLVVLLSVAAVGFTVVGTTVFALWGESNVWAGLILGGMVASGLTVARPAVGAGLWLLLVSLGVGGRVRNWVHASALDDVATGS